ncbi:lytic transglycosylase domain-containing protein [Flavobacteriales bacterium]|nr:lytic transglycosylase domain-containing protein [Flavobacteriales bacterium]
MKQQYSYILTSMVIIFIFSQLFIYSSQLKSDDELHIKQFNMKYGIFAIVQPQGLNFSGENIPIHASEIWERLDKELLKNTYWQSNTLLYFKKAHKYFPFIEPILKKNNIPDDFKYLALIESGLENVISPSGAAGFWQILKGTAKEYDLEVNSSIDERYHLEKSTQVACDYLNKAFDKFGSWTMAAASYNMGQNGVRRSINKQGTDNYYNLYLNQETGRYIFRIIAVKEIIENPKKYGFMFREKDLYSFPEYKIVEVDSTIADLYAFAAENDINYKLLKKFNPWMLKSVLPDESRRKYQIKIPINPSSLIFENIDTSSPSN